MSAIDTLLSHMTNIRKAGGGNYACKCPAHADKSASLSIKEGEDGRVLMHCFAGCSALEVVTAVGLRLEDLWPFKEKDTSALGYQKRRQAMREAGWASALKVLAEESTVVLVAVRSPTLLDAEDKKRLHLAVSRIENAKRILV
jgi:hypothetical protein